MTHLPAMTHAFFDCSLLNLEMSAATRLVSWVCSSGRYLEECVCDCVCERERICVWVGAQLVSYAPELRARYELSVQLGVVFAGYLRGA